MKSWPSTRTLRFPLVCALTSPSVDTSNPAADRHSKTGHQTGALRLG